jgi:hypothetical protein
VVARLPPVAEGGDSGDVYMFPAKSGNFLAAGGGVQRGAVAAAEEVMTASGWAVVGSFFSY